MKESSILPHLVQPQSAIHLRNILVVRTVKLLEFPRIKLLLFTH